MTTKQPRRMSKQRAGSVISDGDQSVVIDTKQLPRRLVIEFRIPYEHQCSHCGREARGEVKAKIDIAPHVREAIEAAIVGAFQLPAGHYEAQVVLGYRGDFMGGALRKL